MSSQDPVVATVDDELGAGDVVRGIRDEEGDKPRHFVRAAGTTEGHAADGGQEFGLGLVASASACPGPSGEARSASTSRAADSSSGWRAVTTTRAPCSASSSAIAAPMPRVPPVTSALLPARPSVAIRLISLLLPCRKPQLSPEGRVKDTPGLWITCAQLVAGMWTCPVLLGISWGQLSTQAVDNLYGTACLPHRVRLPSHSWRSSSARQSKRLIIAVSPVQVRPPLLTSACSEGSGPPSRALVSSGGTDFPYGGSRPHTPGPVPPGAGFARDRSGTSWGLWVLGLGLGTIAWSCMLI